MANIAMLNNPFMYRNKKMALDPNTFKNRMDYIANQDVEELVRKDKEYGSSWRKRGGAQAFSVIARKWDRIETMCSEEKFDILEVWNLMPNFPDQVRDLRRYLLLLEEYLEREGGYNVNPDR